MYTTTFIKVRVVDESMTGHVGWLCEDDVYSTHPVVFP
jgi:hypothetical protein